MAEFFTPRLRCIVNVVVAQTKLARSNITHVVLVGGFSANDWLFDQIKQSLTVYRPESHVNLAVSDGAISFYLEYFVRTRISKYTYGSSGNIEYDPYMHAAQNAARIANHHQNANMTMPRNNHQNHHRETQPEPPLLTATDIERGGCHADDTTTALPNYHHSRDSLHRHRASPPSITTQE